MKDNFIITSNIEDMDIDIVFDFISNSYWANGIPLSVFKKAISNSLCFGILTGDKTQVGFARMITDKATYAYLADVFIIEEYRVEFVRDPMEKRGVDSNIWIWEPPNYTKDYRYFQAFFIFLRYFHFYLSHDHNFVTVVKP